MRLIRSLLAAAFSLLVPAAPALAAGTIPFALSQQIDANGRPLAGCLLYIYQVGTTATPQQVYSDFGLTTPTANPLQCDQSGRIPLFWLADGQVHPRLTDAGGLVIVDVPVMQVLGPSSGGGGGGGGSVDPSSIASTGDIKFRATSETLTGWVKLNNQTIGSATSGATGRANADTQNLFVYLWTNCPNAHCPVSGGRGATALADFSANKTITPIDLRGRMLAGRDAMDNAVANRIPDSAITSGGGDGRDTPQATGGEASHMLLLAEIPSHTHANVLSDPGHTHGVSGTTGGITANHTHAFSWSGTTSTNGAHTHTSSSLGLSGSGLSGFASGGNAAGGVIVDSAGDHAHTYNGTGTTGNDQQDHAHPFSVTSAASGTGVSIINVAAGSGLAHNNMNPFMLGTFYMKL